VDNYVAALRSSRRRTRAPSDVQRNQGRKGHKKRKAACQEKNHGRGDQAGMARSVPHRGRVVQAVKRSPCNVLPERPSRHHRARRLAARMAHEGQTISVSVHHTHRHHPESRLWISNRPIPQRFRLPRTVAPRPIALRDLTSSHALRPKSHLSGRFSPAPRAGRVQQ
jgi:hypothetical protein